VCAFSHRCRVCPSLPVPSVVGWEKTYILPYLGITHRCLHPLSFASRELQNDPLCVKLDISIFLRFLQVNYSLSLVFCLRYACFFLSAAHFFPYVLSFALCLVVSTSAINRRERLVFKMMYCISSGIRNSSLRLTYFLPSSRQHLSYDVCLDVRGKIIGTVLCCIAY